MYIYIYIGIPDWPLPIGYSLLAIPYWFNVLPMGLVSSEDGGVDIRHALAEVERIKDAALNFVKNVRLQKIGQ